MRKGLVVLAMPPAETWEALNLSAFNPLIEVTLFDDGPFRSACRDAALLGEGAGIRLHGKRHRAPRHSGKQNF